MILHTHYVYVSIGLCNKIGGNRITATVGYFQQYVHELCVCTETKPQTLRDFNNLTNLKSKDHKA